MTLRRRGGLSHGQDFSPTHEKCTCGSPLPQPAEGKPSPLLPTANPKPPARLVEKPAFEGLFPGAEGSKPQRNLVHGPSG